VTRANKKVSAVDVANVATETDVIVTTVVAVATETDVTVPTVAVVVDVATNN
jgi:hypothetical protein